MHSLFRLPDIASGGKLPRRTHQSKHPTCFQVLIITDETKE